MTAITIPATAYVVIGLASAFSLLIVSVLIRIEE